MDQLPEWTNAYAEKQREDIQKEEAPGARP